MQKTFLKPQRIEQTIPRHDQDGLPIKPDPLGTTPGRFSAVLWSVWDCFNGLNPKETQLFYDGFGATTTTGQPFF